MFLTFKLFVYVGREFFAFEMVVEITKNKYAKENYQTAVKWVRGIFNVIAYQSHGSTAAKYSAD